MKQRLWYALYELSELGASYRVIETSTTELAKMLDVSQQTASRHLIELEKVGYIMKHASFRGIEVRITEKGMEELRRVYLRLKAFLDEEERVLREMADKIAASGANVLICQKAS